MKIVNKKILALVLVAVTLTSCDSLKGKGKDQDVKKSEENAESVDEKNKDDKQENKDSENVDNKEDKEKKEEAVTSSGTTPKEKLEDAIFKSRVQARAAEILLESAPETITNIKPELEALVEKSNNLIEQAQKALDEME